jgi:hypothetical protein
MQTVDLDGVTTVTGDGAGGLRPQHPEAQRQPVAILG